MKEVTLETLPLQRPFQVLKETEQVAFLVFDGRKTVLAKVDIRGIGHGSIAENVSEIRKTKQLREQIILELENKGSGEHLVPVTDFIIHGSREKTYSRFQEMIQGGKSLSSLSLLQIWKLPRQSLRDLRNIFEVYIHFLRLGIDIDILGNHYNKAPFSKKFLRRWIALLWSENILIDQHGFPRFIDIGIWGLENHPGLKGNLWKNQQKLRGWFSVVLLNLLLLLK